MFMEWLLELKGHLQPSDVEKLKNPLKLTGNSVEFLAFNRTRVNEAGRSLILSNINFSYKALGSKKVPSKGLLFGDDLEGAMMEVEDSSKLASKLVKHNTARRAPFLGRGRGRGRGQRKQPYYPSPRNSGASMSRVETTHVNKNNYRENLI